MLSRILDFSLDHKAAVVFLAALLCGIGAYISSDMNVDVFPDLSAPTVTILTEAHGLQSEEVEKLVTYPLETALNGSPGIRRLRSSSAEGISIIYAEFKWGTDIFRARQVVNERMAGIADQLPDEVSTPLMAPITSIMGEVMLIGVTSDSLSPMELRTLADWTIAPSIKAVNGVANVITIGGEVKQFQVQAHPEKLKYHGIGLHELLNKVAASNYSSTGGVVSQYGNQYSIQGSGRAHEVEVLANAVVAHRNGQSIRVSDVAQVSIGASDKIGDGSVNGNAAIILTVSKQPGVNTLSLTKDLDEAIIGLDKRLPSAVHVDSHIFRQANFIQASISNLRMTLAEGAFFVVIILFIFLMNWRTTLISLLAIPISLLVTIIVLKLFGYTINTMSLGGMAIAIGTLVDDAVIDVENVFKRLRQNAQLPPAERKTSLVVVRDASLEIRSSIIYATLIIIVSFIPLFFLSGMEGRLLTPLGIAFITSVLTSLFVAVTVTPVLCHYMLTNGKLLERTASGTAVERWAQRGYRAVLRPTLERPGWVVGLAVLVFGASMFLSSRLGRSFLPEFNEGSLVISVVGPPGMSLEESNKSGRMTEALLLELPEIEVVSRRTGRAEQDEHAQGVNASEVDAPFTLEQESKDAFLERVREKLGAVPGVNITIGQPIAHRIDHMLSGTRANIAIKIFGPDLSKLYDLGKQVESSVTPIEGLVDVNLEQQIEVPLVRVSPNRTMLAAYGLTVADVMQQMDIAFAGEHAGQINEGQRFFDVVVRYDKPFRDEIEKLEDILIKTPDGGFIPLAEVAEVASVSSPFTISREDVQRKIVVSANVQGRDLRSAVDAIQTAIDSEVVLPEGYNVVFGGQFESEAVASRMLLITAILSIIAIFFLLFLEFRSSRLAFIILLNLPLSLIGGFLIIYFTSGIVSIASTIGLISLFGIATRNGILLVSRYEDLRKEGMSGPNLLVNGALDRLNPILMTAFTTGLALVPLALKGGEAGSEIQSPMAVVILGGLVSATVLNLLVIPCVYGWLQKDLR